MMKVLGIGESVIDEISVVREDGEVTAGDLDAGGPVLVALIMLAKLGADCTFMTTIGRDAGGKYIRDLMAEESVTLASNEQAVTKVNTIRVDALTGQRQKVHSTVEHPPIAGIEPAFLQSFDMIIMDRHEHAAFYEVVRHKKAATKLVIDPSTELSDFTLDMMRQADCPIVTIGTLAQVGRQQTLATAARALYSQCGKPLVVTLGKFGSLICDGAKLQVIPAFEVGVVNDLGAGDVYRGAFAYGQMQGWALVECAMYGNAAAALHCTKLGNAAEVPERQDIEHLTKRATFRETDSAALEAYFAELRRDFAPLVAVK